MTERLNRTPEWQRLKNAGFVHVLDQPGTITVFRKAPGEKTAKKLFWMWIGFSLMGFLGFAGLGPWGILLGGMTSTLFSSLTFGLMARAARKTLKKYADQVIFTPRNIYFVSGRRELGSLPREGMQQIVADTTGYGLRHHRFFADVGYVSAFAGSDPSDHMIINNILMAAFNQPVHLDQRQDAAPAYEPPPPTVGGLAAAPSIALKPVA